MYNEMDDKRNLFRLRISQSICEADCFGQHFFFCFCFALFLWVFCSLLVLNKKCQLSYFPVTVTVTAILLATGRKVPINCTSSENLYLCSYNAYTLRALVIYLFVYLCLWPNNFTRMKQSKSGDTVFVFIAIVCLILVFTFWLRGDKRGIKS